MAELSVEQQLVAAIHRLTPEQQSEMLTLVNYKLNETPPGEPGPVFLERTSHIAIAPADLAEMAAAIEEGCEGVDPETDVNFDE
ncbi:MAG: hypothetical protein H6672_06155 [Anaerolineaceae bacterium]|nr:hypothetical protein [Anaerolineaceae bacterium]